MTAKAKHYYQHKEVDVVRPAKAGDKGFDPRGGPQSLIELEDGSQKVVADTEVLDDAKAQPPPKTATPTSEVPPEGVDNSAGGSPPTAGAAPKA